MYIHVCNKIVRNDEEEVVIFEYTSEEIRKCGKLKLEELGT